MKFFNSLMYATVAVTMFTLVICLFMEAYISKSFIFLTLAFIAVIFLITLGIWYVNT